MSHNDIDTSDFYSYEHLLADDERLLLHAVRKFMDSRGGPRSPRALVACHLSIRGRPRHA